MSKQRTVKFIDLSQNAPDMPGFSSETFRSVLKRGKYILDEQVEEFERNFARYHGVKHCIGVGNGFDALQIIMRCLNLEGKGILVPTNAPLPVWMAVSAVGAKPIGWEPGMYTHVLDPEWIRDRIMFDNEAIIAVHLYGLVAPMHEIRATGNGRILIEDCCQAHGAMYDGKEVGTFGEMSAFSFYPTKNMGAYGDGGAILTNSDVLAERARDIREYGKGKRLGINSRLDELQAAFLKYRLMELPKENRGRQDKAFLYMFALAHTIGVTLPTVLINTTPVWHQFVIMCDKRDELKTFLAENGIETMIHYPTPAWQMPYYNPIAYTGKPTYDDDRYPISTYQSQHVLSLPIGKGVTVDDVEYVCEKINEFYGKNL